MTDGFKHLLAYVYNGRIGSTPRRLKVSTVPPDGRIVRFFETCIFDEYGILPSGRVSTVVAHYGNAAEARIGHAAIANALSAVFEETD